jgi:hypothetical protein
MLNYEVEPALLAPLVPSGTELDSWRGRTHVSVVGFLFLDTRVLGLRIPFHTNFEEVNLRFYVRRKAGIEWRRGVVFVKELVPRWAMAFVARTLYGERYVSLPMGHRIEPEEHGEPSSVSYRFRHAGRDGRLELVTEPGTRPLEPGSEEEFIAEHYWGYAKRRDGSTTEYAVEHPPWWISRARDARLDADVAALYGERFVEALSARPSSAFLANGSTVTVRKGVLVVP